MFTQRDGLLGWATGRLVHHDKVAPGAIRRLLESGPARRQAVFALIASEIDAERHHQVTGTELPTEAAHRRAHVLRDGSARDILTELLGREPPTGLKGGLERLGLQALEDPRLYARLIEVYSDPDQRFIAEALERVGKITPTMIRVMDLLPSALLHHAVLSRLELPAQARAFVESAAWVRSVNSRATDLVITYALDRLPTHKGLDDLIARFLRRADTPLGQPLPADDEVRPLARVADLITYGRRMRNCIGTNRKISGALSGTTAYAVFGKEGEEQAILEFVRLSDTQFLFFGAHGPGNLPVPHGVMSAVRAKCVAAGVPFIAPAEPAKPFRYGPFIPVDHDFEYDWAA